MSKDRRGLQKKLSVLFDGVWMPKKKRPQEPPAVDAATEPPQQQESQIEDKAESDEIVYGT